jgi:hypothetical protein
LPLALYEQVVTRLMRGASRTLANEAATQQAAHNATERMHTRLAASRRRDSASGLSLMQPIAQEVLTLAGNMVVHETGVKVGA